VIAPRTSNRRAGASGRHWLGSTIYSSPSTCFRTAQPGHAALGEDARSTTVADPARARALLEEALLTLTPGTHPVGCRLAAVKLGDARRAISTQPLDAYRLGVAAAEELYARAYVPANQGVELALNTDLYDRCVDLCLETGHDHGRSAVLYAEAARARQFLDQMGLGGIPAPPGAAEPGCSEEQLLVELRSRVLQWESPAW